MTSHALRILQVDAGACQILELADLKISIAELLQSMSVSDI